mmetsp:Transcript_17253/g.30958  ORF Transcript_17253/g.30958 Transcript_17253/m.30958 type:complete len:211 (-) Transcript_17253:1409-2041(-)
MFLLNRIDYARKRLHPHLVGTRGVAPPFLESLRNPVFLAPRLLSGALVAWEAASGAGGAGSGRAVFVGAASIHRLDPFESAVAWVLFDEVLEGAGTLDFGANLVHNFRREVGRFLPNCRQRICIFVPVSLIVSDVNHMVLQNFHSDVRKTVVSPDRMRPWYHGGYACIAGVYHVLLPAVVELSLRGASSGFVAVVGTHGFRLLVRVSFEQ